MKPLVSVIVPNYNHAAFLKERLDSVFNQTFQDFEVILLDDCSTDDSIEILSNYALQPKVTHCVFNERNTGNTFSQWNKGLALAKGEFIWIAESDDFCDVNLLQELLKPMKQNENIVLSYCQSNRVNCESLNTGDWLSHTDDLDKELFLSDFIMKGNDFIENFLIFKNVIPNASAVIFRRDEVFKKIKKLNQSSYLKYCGDWLFYIQLVVNKEICYNSKKLNSFRYHNRSVIASAKKTNDRITIIDIDLKMRNIVMSFLKQQKISKLNIIKLRNKKIKRNLNYEKALLFFRNNNKLKGVILLFALPDLFLKNYKFKKHFKLRINRFLNK
ncbi:glycosyltransferase family 2 protein [uncultured Polaribacter sp.]|uniref:glycosyltransferase family 2 protein n=1 Tax=uncultured Polaribacter sp. TaxID=174711 RepID=UPI00260D5737|nr:glycosyltransferase family 2 protein [uncultured Polaribacter sp.]